MVAVLAVLLIMSQSRGPLPRSQALDLPQASTAPSYRADTTESESVCSSTDFMPGLACAVHGPNSIASTRADNQRAHDGKYWEGQSDLRISSSILRLLGCPYGQTGTAEVAVPSACHRRASMTNSHWSCQRDQQRGGARRRSGRLASLQWLARSVG